MTSRQYDPIDEQVAVEIERLHKKHPKLGRTGLLEALRQSDLHLDSRELKLFMAQNRIRAEREWRPWNWHGLPSWWLGGGPPRAPE